MKNSLFTPEELEELRRIDAEIDAEPMTDEDYRLSDFIDGILFPEQKERKERKRADNRAQRDSFVEKHGEEALKAKYKADYQKNKEADRERKKAWYAANKDRIRAQQQAYRIRTGRQMSPEEKAQKKAETAARNAAK